MLHLKLYLQQGFSSSTCNLSQSVMNSRLLLHQIWRILSNSSTTVGKKYYILRVIFMTCDFCLDFIGDPITLMYSIHCNKLCDINTNTATIFLHKVIAYLRGSQSIICYCCVLPVYNDEHFIIIVPNFLTPGLLIMSNQ